MDSLDSTEWPLAEAKLTAPRTRAGLVKRQRILEALDGGDHAALTLVAAPPGYGKTTAVRAWCSRQDAALVWVTLDAGDNDPTQLWKYVATAVDRIRPGLGRRALQRLGFVGVPIEAPVDELMNGIAGFEGRLVIVLDDLQTVTDQECLASIDYAIGHLPATARLIAITRTDPTLALAPLRVSGALLELRAGELAFTASEAHELLVVRDRLELATEDVETLCRRCEGWPAGLILASAWLRGVDDTSGAVRDFGGDHGFVVEYLSHVMLETLPDDVRLFLLQASVLGQFTAELCDAVLERSDSAAALANLGRVSPFINRPERGGWFRVHSLITEFAGFQLAALDPGAPVELHRRAAQWLADRAMPVEAVAHAANAGDHEAVARILAENHFPLLVGGGETLLRWVRTLPDEQLVRHADVVASAATIAMCLGGQTLEQRRLLRLIDRTRAELPETISPYAVAVARMVLAVSVDADPGRAVAAGREAVEIAADGADEAVVAALAGYARALYFDDRPDEAWAAGLRALEHPDIERRTPGHAHVRSTLALVAADRGHLTSARKHGEKAKAILGRAGMSRSWLGANASAALGVVDACEGNDADAERQLAYAEHVFQDEVATLQHAWLQVLLARVRCRRGRIDKAEATARQAREELDELGHIGRVAALAADVEREIEQARGRASDGEVLEVPTQAELAVLRLLASELSVRQIGEQLFLSSNTVRSHTRAIYRKLGVSTRAEAVARAYALELLGRAESPM